MFLLFDSVLKWVWKQIAYDATWVYGSRNIRNIYVFMQENMNPYEHTEKKL